MPALGGFTIGGGSGGPAASPSGGTTALSGFTIGSGTGSPPTTSPGSTATPPATSTPSTGTVPVTGNPVTSPTAPLPSWKTTATTLPPDPATLVAKSASPDTSKLFSGFAGMNSDVLPEAGKATDTDGTATPAVTKDTKPVSDDSIEGIADNTLAGLPAASKQVSDVINKPIKDASDFLSNTSFIKGWAASQNKGNYFTNLPTQIVQKLADLSPAYALQGVTAGAYQAPDLGGNKDIVDGVLQQVTQTAGAILGINAIGAVATPKAAIEGLSAALDKYPLLAKYASPYAESFLKNLVGLTAQSQLNPSLANNMQARTKELVTSVAEAPLYTALGAIKSAWTSVPTSFLMGFGMAKLSGASNTDALQSGLLFGMMDGFGRIQGDRGLSPQDIRDKMNEEALGVLNQYAESKLTLDSTPEEFKAAYRTAAHQTHPDVGGTVEAFNSVKNAYDLLSKGAVSKVAPGKTEPEQSIASLKGDVQKGMDKYGVDATHQALMNNLNLDKPTADRIINAAQKPEDMDATTKNGLADIMSKMPQKDGVSSRFSVTGKPIEGINPKQETRLSAEDAAPFSDKAATRYWNEKIQSEIDKGGPIVIGADDLKDHFGQDYNDHNHPVYSRAAYLNYERALKESKSPDVIFTGGGPASGKTELITENLKERNFKGIIYDSNLASYDNAVKQIEQTRAAGKRVEIAGVTPNLEKARTFSIQRENEKGRGISDATFARGHAGFPATIEKLIENGIIKPDEVHIIDTRDHDTFEQSLDAVANNKYVTDPLAHVKSLGYNEAELKETYAKKHFNIQTGERESGLQSSGKPGETSPQDRTGKENADRRGDEKILGKNKEINPEDITTLSKFNKLSRVNQEAVFNSLPEELQKEITGMTNEDLGKEENETVQKILNGKQKIKVTESMKPEVIERIGKGNYMRLFRTEGNYSSLDELATDGGFDSDESLLSALSDGIDRRRTALQGGFINPEKIAEDIAAAANKVNDFIKKESKTNKLTGEITDALYQHEGQRKAFRHRLSVIIKENINLLTPKEWENVTLYDDGSINALSPKEKTVYDKVIIPLKKFLTEDRNKIRELGGVITEDIEGSHTPRHAKEKNGPIDLLLKEAGKKINNIRNGGKLTTSLGSGSKHRVYYAATDANGKRSVVAVKDGQVSKIEGKVITDLGTIKPKISPKIKEFVDGQVMPKLEKLARDLGIDHERLSTAIPGKRKAAGVSYKGAGKIITRAATPERVLIHEIGHQIDEKYGMKEIFKKDDSRNFGKDTSAGELRALADLRLGSNPDSALPSFKQYVRNGSEKMAVMFEAYLHVPEKFKEVAPNIYEKFDDFLRSHPELAPIRDIKPSLDLQAQEIGGKQLAGKVGSSFVDKDGKKYTISQATIKEIEANTSTEYYKNTLANYALSLDRTHNALKSLDILQKIKESPGFEDIIVKPEDGEATPTGWRTVDSDKMPQFRGYFMEPKLAEALEDLADRDKGKLYFPVFDEINNLLTAAIVINPVMHFPNVAVGWAASESATGVIPGSTSKSRANFARAFNAVKNKDEMYLTYLENGAPFQALKQTSKELSDQILKIYSDEVKDNPMPSAELAKALGYLNPLAMMKGISHISETATWVGNDVMFMHAILDHQDAYGSTIQQAAKEVSKRMADYRIPSRIGPGLVGRRVAQTLNSRAFMFARFHWSGVIKPWIENVKDSANPGSSADERKAGLRTLAFFALMSLLVYPFINKMIRGFTHSNTSYLSESGPLKLSQNVGNVINGKDSPSQFMSQIAAFSPGLSDLLQLTPFNTDMFTRSPIYNWMGKDPNAEGLGTFALSTLSPLSSSNSMTPENFALSLVGIYTPQPAAKILYNAQVYEEKPVLDKQLKQLMLDGNTAQATALATDFNNRLVANYQTDMLQSGKPTLTQDQIPAFLKTEGVKLPGVKAMANAAALYGDGSLTSKSSLLSTVVTYAKAIGTDPATAFERIFTGQQIVRVDNAGFFNPDSAIIVQRLPLADSETVRSQDAAAQGLSSSAMAGLQLDHFIPLEAGGSNEKGNLDLITTEQNQVDNAKVETPIAAALKAGTISRAHVLEYITRYKIGTLHEVPNQYYADLYKDKYNSQPLTADQVVQLINSGQAK